jgi:hypothetical protein
MHVHPLEPRIAHLEGVFEQTNERLGSIDRTLDSVDRRLDGMDQRFNWVIGTVLGTWITVVAMQVATVLAVIPHLK